MLSFAVSNIYTNPDLLFWCFLKIRDKDATCRHIQSIFHGSRFLFPGRIIHISWLIHWYTLLQTSSCHHQSHWVNHPLVRRISQDHLLTKIAWRIWNVGFPLPMQAVDEYVYFSRSFWPIEKKLGIHFQWCQIPSGDEVHQIWLCTSQSH